MTKQLDDFGAEIERRLAEQEGEPKPTLKPKPKPKPTARRMMGRTMACLVVAGSLGVGLAPVPAGAESQNYHKHVACNESYRDSKLHTEQDCYGHYVKWDHTNPYWKEGQTGEHEYYYCSVKITCDYGYPAVSKAELTGIVRLIHLYQLRRCKDDATKITTDCEPLPYYGTGQQDDPAN